MESNFSINDFWNFSILFLFNFIWSFMEIYLFSTFLKTCFYVFYAMYRQQQLMFNCKLTHWEESYHDSNVRKEDMFPIDLV